jgi:nicotinamidase-related amidase
MSLVSHPGASDLALVVIDMQNANVKNLVAGSYVLPDNRRVFVENCVRLVRAAHRARLPVFFVKVDRRRDQTDWPRFRSPASAAALVSGTLGNQLIAELKALLRVHRDYVVVKRRLSAFNHTSLDFQLRTLGVRRLVVAGFATNWGVESTVRQAWDLEYETVVASDACASFTLEDHLYSLEKILSVRGTVASTDVVVAMFESRRSGERHIANP